MTEVFDIADTIEWRRAKQNFRQARYREKHPFSYQEVVQLRQENKELQELLCSILAIFDLPPTPDTVQ